MRILFIGDIVGKPGREIVERAVAGLVREERLDLVVANAENAAGGSGLTPAIYRELMRAGVDAITLGDHVYRRREIYSVLEERIEHRQAGEFAAGVGRPQLGGRHGPQRRARRRLLPAGPAVHEAGRQPVARGRPRAGRDAERRPRAARRFSRRSHQRNAADGPLSRRPRQRRARHAHARADRRRVHSARRARPFNATSA